MAWEWVAPVVTGLTGAVGVFFTWLSGAQGRAHTERMQEQTRENETRAWLLRERRDAYLAALTVIDLEMRRHRYKREGKSEKLQELERRWPKAERVQLSMNAVIGVSTFGSAQMQEIAREWLDAVESDGEDALTIAVQNIRDQARQELNAHTDT